MTSSEDLPMSTRAPASLDEKPFGCYFPSRFERVLVTLMHACPRSWLGRRVAYILRKVAMTCFARGPRDALVFGVRFRLYPFDNVAEKRLYYTPQYFDAPERTLLAEHVVHARDTTHDPYVFIDVGANVGGYSLFVSAQARGHARILAVEPQPSVFERLCDNLQLNPTSGIKAVAYALADSVGEMTLFLAPANRGEASLKVLSADPAAGHAVQVQTTTLHQLLLDEGVRCVDALKIDIEGAEDLVLVPFFREAPKALWPRLLVLERGGDRWNVDLVSLLQEKGYALVLQTRLNVVLKLTGSL